MSYLPLKIDLHVHTCYSKDSCITLEDILTQAKRKGLDGVAVTDHDTVEGAVKIARIIERSQKHNRPIIIPGIEVSTIQGHILGINVLTQIPKGLGVEETIERIHEVGGLAIAAHPQVPFKDGLGLNPKILSLGLDAIEVINSSSFPFQPLTCLCKKFAERCNLPQTAGSDSHMPEAIGLAYTLIEGDDPSIDNLIESIRRGLTKPFGRGMPIRLRVKKALGVKA